MNEDVESSTDVEALRVEVVRLRTAIRQHKGEKGHQRCKLDDAQLYSVLPEGDHDWEPTLPPECEWMTECQRYWQSRQDTHQITPEYTGVVVTGTPGGDGECWHLVVAEDEYRRVVGEEEYKVEMEFREHIENLHHPHHDFSFSTFTLGPGDLLRAAGLTQDEPITIWLQLRKPDAPPG